ncbi:MULTISPECIES: FIST N-terminal domain-containing protein [unclassified Ruegeria]|uniref:FIST N-terminal domain-containing protein n=1 Tax=unclassified Ruegeria TaxID=2625375 RepID=UPI001ADC9B19|nr:MULTISPECIES: FIST N-terminal domain-containing protein [unclassified Ruegeria]MBO9412317.1 FIST C-terminal domain-containing protein [Ruegeria sp. R8_1]MBO9416445.1 FIST C-terminal domain-containing protein [Ruegeria sp. R8_2]
MDQAVGWATAPTRAPGIVRTACVPYDTEDAVTELLKTFGAGELSLVILFVTDRADAASVIAQAAETFAPAPVVGCTTAGELAGAGYTENQIVAIGLPASHFDARILPVPDLDTFLAKDLIHQMIRNRNEMTEANPDWHHEFTFLLIDGLSTKEDALTSELALGLGPVPLFGGSAGDGTDFETTYVLHDGRALENAAILAQIRTRCPIKVFKTDHLVPTAQRMVVTKADPARRIVREINAEPAAREYARILGKDPEQLTTFTFAAHPVVVQIGGQHHVRAIQRVDENGDLVFFSAIDEGLVLTLAEPRDMVEHLEQEIEGLTEAEAPDTILGCDCILRRLEAQEKQMTGALSAILADNHVVGFSTYGEQFNSIHVNQTLTGVAIYPPEEDRHD